MRKRNTDPVVRLLNTGSRLVSACAGLLAVILILYSGYVLYDSMATEVKALNTPQDLQKYKPAVMAEAPEGAAGPSLAEINPDYRGWVTVYDTTIDYPVVQGINDLYYASHDVYRENSLTGAIYLAAGNRPDFSDSYNLLYGHHMDSGAMFGSLDRFRDEAFFRSHQTGAVTAADGTIYTVRFFAVADTDAYEKRVYDVGDRAEQTAAFLAEAWNRGAEAGTKVLVYDPETAEGAGKILALSTCIGVETNGRLVLFGRMDERKPLTPTATPTATPTVTPTSAPDTTPTATPAVTPTAAPDATPTAAPTATPTATPAVTPTAAPDTTPTAGPTATPTATPAVTPTAAPDTTPTAVPTATPAATPAMTPTVAPTATPTAAPTTAPTATPTAAPTLKPAGSGGHAATPAPADTTVRLRVRYFTKDGQAFPDAVLELTPGEDYYVVSPQYPGYEADTVIVQGILRENTVVDVFYTPKASRMRIRYVFEDGREAAPAYEAAVFPGGTYDVESPAVPGYRALKPRVAGTGSGVEEKYTVVYVPEDSAGYTEPGQNAKPAGPDIIYPQKGVCIE